MMKVLVFRAATFLVVAVAAVGAAWADEPPPYAKQNCDAVIQSAAAFHECYAANLDAAHKALEETYQSLLAQKTFYVKRRGAARRAASLGRLQGQGMQIRIRRRHFRQ